MRRVLSVAIAITWSTGIARANDDAPQSVTHEYSPYEKETIANALAETHRELDADPEGKIVEGVDVVRLDVFEERDPVPRFFNVFHWTSKRYAVERELLAGVGDRYSQVLIDETARNLRKLSGQLSVVLVVAVRGSRRGAVRVLMITKDVWSLRLNSSWVVTDKGFEYVLLQPSEQNVFGTHHVAGLSFELRPLSYATGAAYQIPWILDTRWQATLAAALVVNRDTHHTEGTTGNVSLNYPLWSTQTPFGANAQVQWKHDVVRQYTDARLAGFRSKNAPPDSTAIPWLYRRDYDSARAYVVRAFGWARKIALTVGGEAVRQKYSTQDLSAYDPLSRDEFLAKKVPQSDTRVGPFAQLRLYRTDYSRLLDVDLYGLQEDIRLGYDVLGKVYPVFRGLGSTRSFVGFDLRGQYTFTMGDGFIRPVAIAVVETGDRLFQATLDATLHVAAPRSRAGRLVYDLDLTRRFRNYYNDNTTLGGTSRLRGYPTAFLNAPNAVAQTVEWRSPPLEILRTQWGLVGFWDTATAFESVAGLEAHHSVGTGIRVLFPQFDRRVFRFDVGVPLYRGERPPGVSPFGFLFSVEQAFPVPNIIDPTKTVD